MFVIWKIENIQIRCKVWNGFLFDWVNCCLDTFFNQSTSRHWFQRHSKKRRKLFNLIHFSLHQIKISLQQMTLWKFVANLPALNVSWNAIKKFLTRKLIQKKKNNFAASCFPIEVHNSQNNQKNNFKVKKLPRRFFDDISETIN